MVHFPSNQKTFCIHLYIKCSHFLLASVFLFFSFFFDFCLRIFFSLQKPFSITSWRGFGLDSKRQEVQCSMLFARSPPCLGESITYKAREIVPPSQLAGASKSGRPLSPTNEGLLQQFHFVSPQIGGLLPWALERWYKSHFGTPQNPHQRPM